jgi:copper chaperone CopZ
MVFIQERIGGQSQDGSTVQARIEQRLLKSGFKLVDREQIKAIDEKDLAAAISENNPAKAQAIAQRFGAQLFITGVANAASGGVKNLYGTQMHTYEAEANIRCYRSDTGQLLSSIPGTATRGVQRVWRSAAKQALDLQAQQIAPKVVNDILRFWQDALEGRGEVQLHVANIAFKQYIDLKKALTALKGVQNVKATYRNKIAEISIETEMTAEGLAEKIVTEIDENIEIQSLTQNVIKGKYGG